MQLIGFTPLITNSAYNELFRDTRLDSGKRCKCWLTGTYFIDQLTDLLDITVCLCNSYVINCIVQNIIIFRTNSLKLRGIFSMMTLF